MKKLYIAITILLVIWLVYLLFFAKEPDLRSIIKCVTVLIGYITAIAGIRRRQRPSDVLRYKKIYSDVIGNAFQHDKRSFHVLLHAIKCYNENKYERALSMLESLENACTSNADYAAVLMFRALVYSERGMEEKAIQTYEELLQYNQTSSKAWSNLGMHYDNMNRTEQAENAYQRAIECNPDNPYPYANMAVLLLKKGLPERAVEQALHAIRLDPKLYQAMSAASMGYALLGDAKKARKYLELYVKNGGNRKELQPHVNSILGSTKKG